MNLMQTKLEQVFKEYIVFKEYVEKNTKSVEDLRTDVARKMEESDDEDALDVVFQIFGEKQLELGDLNQLASRLYHYHNAYQELIEIPTEISDEIKNIQVNYLFTIKDGKREIVDKEFFENCKRQFKEANTQLISKD